MSPIRNPLVLLYLAAQRLWRNRSLFLILLACWLVSSATATFVIRPIFISHQPGAKSLLESTLVIDRLTFTSLSDLLSETELMIGHWLRASLPKLDYVGLGSQYMQVLALGSLAAALIWVWFHCPDWLPLAAHHRLRWPIYVTLASFLVSGASAGFGFFSLLSGNLGALGLHETHNITALVLAISSLVVGPFGGAVLTAFLWHLVLQIGRGAQWNMRRAIIEAVGSWLPIAWLGVVLAVPHATLWLSFMWRPRTLMTIYNNWYALLGVALSFVPWVILQEERNFRGAVARNFQIIWEHRQDLVAFVLRYVLITVPVYAVFDMLVSPTIHVSILGETVRLGLKTWTFVLLVAIVVLYTKLREAEQKVVATDPIAPVD